MFDYAGQEFYVSKAEKEDRIATPKNERVRPTFDLPKN
jgi:hypothetical protein